MPSTVRREIPVQSIVLNPANSRHDPVPTAGDAYKALFADAKLRGEMVALATDIAANGLDPSSLLIVEPVDKYWRVLEGNRRVAVLRCMASPDLIPEVPEFAAKALSTYRERFAHLGRGTAIPTNVLVVETDDEELANHLISLKHTGPNAHKGAGTMPWDTAGRARHEESVARAAGSASPEPSNKQAGKALSLLDALAVHFVGDQEVEALLARARKRGLTTLGRLLLRTDNQVRLGVQIDAGVARFLAERDALRAAMVRVLSDLGGKDLNSRTTNKVADVTTYLDKIERDLPAADDRLPSAESASPPTTTSPTPAKKRQKAPVVIRRPFQGLVLNHAHPKTLAVLGELRKHRIDDAPYTCAILTRVLVDLYTHDVLTALEKKAPEGPAARTKVCLELVDPPTSPRKRKFPLIWDALNTGTGDLSVDAMHAYVHRHDYKATPDVVRNQSEHYGPFLAALDDHVDQALRAQNSPK